MVEKIKQLEKYITRVYSKYDVCETKPSCDSHQRSFNEGLSVGESRIAYNVAKIMGFEIEEPDEEIDFHVEVKMHDLK